MVHRTQFNMVRDASNELNHWFEFQEHATLKDPIESTFCKALSMIYQ